MDRKRSKETKNRKYISEFRRFEDKTGQSNFTESKKKNIESLFRHFSNQQTRPLSERCLP